MRVPLAALIIVPIAFASGASAAAQSASPGAPPSASPSAPGPSGSPGPSVPPVLLVTCGFRAYPGLGIDGPVVDPRGDDDTAARLGQAIDKWHEEFPGADEAEWRLAGSDETGSLYLGRTDEMAEGAWISIEVRPRDDGTWGSNIGECTPRRVISADLGTADWWLDPALPVPGADATELHILLMERACASGRPPDGRVAEPEVRYSSEAVAIAIGVQRAPGDQGCPGNPAVPATIALAEPLGGRTLLDGSYLPPRAATPPESWDPNDT